MNLQHIFDKEREDFAKWYLNTHEKVFGYKPGYEELNTYIGYRDKRILAAFVEEVKKTLETYKRDFISRCEHEEFDARESFQEEEVYHIDHIINDLLTTKE